MIQRGRMGSGQRGHGHAVWGRSDNVYSTLQCKMWGYKEQIRNTCRLQRATMENVGKDSGRSTSSGAKCSIFNSRHDTGLRIPRLVSPRSSHLFTIKKGSIQRPSWSQTNPPYSYHVVWIYNMKPIRATLMRQLRIYLAQIHTSTYMKPTNPRSEKGLPRRHKETLDPAYENKREEKKIPLSFKTTSSVKPTILASRCKIYLIRFSKMDDDQDN